MREHYYISSGAGFEEITKAEWQALVGEQPYGSYAAKLYRGEITLAAVPEECRAAVQAIAANKTERWGAYEDQGARPEEVCALAEGLLRAELTRKGARELFAGIERLREGAADALASTAAGVYPLLKEDGSLIRAGTRINWQGAVKRAAVDLWDNARSAPDTAPALWEDLPYRDGIRIIPDAITVGTAFAKDELGWWGDAVYRSILNGENVWTPEQNPNAWELAS